MNNKKGVKLLAAVAAFAIVLGAFAVVSSDSSAEETVTTYTLNTANSVTVYADANATEGTQTSLADAIANQDQGQVWQLKAGNYNVLGTNESWTVSKMVITADDITIKGAPEGKTTIYADYFNGGNQSAPNNQGSMIILSGNNAKLKDLTVMPAIQYGSAVDGEGNITEQWFTSNKAIEIYSSNATLENIVLEPNTLAKNETEIEAAPGVTIDIYTTDYGGSIYLNNQSSINVSITNSTINNGFITTSGANNENITLNGCIFNCNDSDSLVIYDSNGETVFSNIYEVTESTVNINKDLSDESSPNHILGIMDRLVSGFIVNLNADQKLTQDEAVMNIAEGVVFNIAKGVTLDVTDITGVVLDGELNLNAGASFKGAIGNDIGEDTENIIYIDTITAGDAGVSFTKGSIVIAGDIANIVETESTITILSGDAKLVADVPSGTTIIVSSEAKLKIDQGDKVTVKGTITNEGTIENNGTIVVEGAIESTGTIENTNGAINTDSKGTVTGDVSGNQPVPSGSFAMGDHLEGDYPVKTYAFLTQDLTIPEGITLTVKGTLELNGYNLFVKGTLVVESKGKILGFSSNELLESADTGIILCKTGTIQNSGIIGSDSFVMVKDEAANGSVVMNNISGIEFGLTKEVSTYTLTISGVASKSASAYSLTVSNAYITDLEIKDLENVTIGAKVLKNGSLTISSKATADADVTLLNGATLTVDGKLINDCIVTMYNGTTANINGIVNGAKFQAKTGEYPTYDDDGARNNIDTDVALGVTSEITLTNMKGIVISITSKTYTEDEVSKTKQMMNVVGTPDLVDKDIISANIDITNPVYVPAGGELVLSKDMTMSGSGTIITEGMLAITEGTIENYKGAHYQMKVPGETSGYTNIYYYTNFDDAYAKIASSEGKTVTINGGYEFAKSYIIAADQIVDFDTATISEEGVVTVEEDGELSNGFTEIKGTLIVKDGATCTPNADSYEVSSKDADGTWTYTSAELAIANAKAGDTVYITNSVTFDKDATIPEGVTVDVASDASISAGEDLTINGKIINNGTIAVTGNLLVNGEVVNENSFTVTGESSEATVKGTYSGELSVTSNKINAAKYSDDVDVYTSVASAIAATSKMDVPKDITVTGEVSEPSEIVLAAGQKLTIDGTVVLKSVRVIVDSQLIITSTGKLSADVIAATGTETTAGALSDSVITLKEAQDVTFSVKKNESTSTTTLYMGKTTSGLTGTFNVATGSVELKDAITVGNTLTVKVASGAELVIKNSISGTAKNFSNEGTLTVAATTSISSMKLGGTVDVRKDVTLTVTDITVTGKIDTAENAKVSIAGGKYMYIGSTPETLGASTSVSAAVEFGTNAYVVVFNGSSFTNTNDVKMDSTSYSINDVAFAKVYIKEGDTVLTSILDGIVDDLDDLDGTSPYTWKSGSSTADNIGQYDTVNTTIGYEKAKFTISAGPGLIVYIDDVLVNTTIQNSYEIGTHTITIYIDKGYEGTPVIKVNGNTITDGKLVVTTEMLKNDSNMIVVTGATPSVTPTPTPIQPEKDDGMGLTDYLLIVLVILAAILVVVVAIRMMRS